MPHTNPYPERVPLATNEQKSKRANEQMSK